MHEIVSELMEEELVEAGFELLHREDSFIEKIAVEPGGGAPFAPRRGKEERFPIIILDTVQGDLLSSKFNISSCKF